jgi:dGTPase
LIEGTVNAAESLADVEAVRAHPRRLACFTPETAAGAAQLNSFLRVKVYESEQLVASRARSTALIEALFEFFLARPECLPANYREESAGQPLHRQVCDYIAGMTDGFLVRTCAQLRISEPTVR